MSFRQLLMKLGLIPKPKPVPPPYFPDPTFTRDNRAPIQRGLVFAGDSITYIDVWKDAFPQYLTVNRGIGGDNSAQLLARLQDIIDMDPAIVHVMIGGNDVIQGVPHAWTTAAHQAILNTLVEKTRARILVSSILPFTKDLRDWFPQIPKSYANDIRALNAALKLACKVADPSEHTVRFIDQSFLFTDPRTGYGSPECYTDGVHLSAVGYALLHRTLETALSFAIRCISLIE